MPDRRRFLLAGVAAAAGCAGSGPAQRTAPGDAATRLRALLASSDESTLDRNPIWGLYRGDLRRAGRFGDFLSDAYVQAEQRAASADLAALAAIPRDRLTGTDRVAADAFAWTRHDAQARFAAPAAAIGTRLPLDHFNGWHLFFPEMSSGEGMAPFRTVKDYEDGLTRLDGFITWLDQAVARMREGMALGIVQPRLVVDRMIPQFARLAAEDRATSSFYGPIRQLPADFAPATRERLAAAYAEAVERRLQPAFARVHRFLVDEYRRAARETVGVGALPGGDAHYAMLVRSNTTTDLSPEQIHRLGLAEVERITAGMQAVRRQVRFGGSLPEFFADLRSAPTFRPASAQALGDGYRAIGQRVDAAMPRLFELTPKTPLEIRPTPAEQAATDASGRYVSGAPDTGRPGIFYYNTHELESRRTWGMETLYLHEAVPGHHYQSMVAAENDALPKLLRFDGMPAYWEGWALYAESLGPELGLFDDPYQRFGHHNDAMLRALRLVVDTGLHAFGWSRERAIEYMLDHSAMSRNDVTVEVERYIVDPGQALAYKVGELTIRRLRTRAERTLGARFDLRAFHTQVLDTGAIPLPVLEAKIDAWLADAR